MRLTTTLLTLASLFSAMTFAAPPLSSEIPSSSSALHANAWIEIDGDAFEHNVKTLQNHLKKETQLCAIMKADAYGHGLALLLPKVIKLSVPCIGVTSNDEIKIIRESGFTGRLMRVKSPTPGEIAGAQRYQVEELIGNAELAAIAGEIAATQDKTKPIPIHLAINSSGMSRNGIDLTSEANKQAVLAIAKNPHLKIVGIMTHYPTEDKQAVLTALERFNKEAEWLIKTAKLDRKQIVLHTANTFATLNIPESHLDLVRPGRAFYGDMGPDDTNFKRVLSSFKSRVSAVNAYPKGSTVGYNNTYTLTRDSLLANIPIGYSDGYRRVFSNQGHVLISGQRVPIVGLISMNTFMVDVTDIANPVKPGDEVVLLGQQGEQRITQEELEKISNTLLADLYTVWAQTNYKILKE